jgi:hypothetical protein
MYNGFSEKSGHLTKWVWIIKDFMNQACVGGHHVAKCPFKICWNYRFFTRDEVQVHLCNKGFISNYLVWHHHRDVEPPAVGTESNENEDEDWLDEIIAVTDREYKVGSLESRHHH